MKKGTLTPNGMGGYDLEIHNVSGDWKSNLVNTAIALGMAMATGAFTYAGSRLANIVDEKMNEASKKKKKKEQK